MGFNDPSYKIKNTFVEFSSPEENESGIGRTRRTRSDVADLRRHSPLVLAAKSPVGSPLLQPVNETMQAVPIEEVNFELLEEAAPVGSDPSVPGRSRLYSSEQAAAQGTPRLGRDEPAYVVPTTPSPFLHSAFPPSVVPPFGSYGYGMPDMGLPPAYGTEGEAGQVGDGTFTGQEMDGQFMQDMDGQFMQGIFVPEMYDQSYGQYMPYGWAAVPMEAAAGYGADASGPLSSEGTAATKPAEGFMETFQAPAPQEQPAPSPPAEVPNESYEKPAKEGGRRGKGRNREAKEEEKTEKSTKASATGNSKTGASGSASNAVAASSSSPAPTEKATEGKDAEPEQPSIYTTVMLRNIPNKYTREMLVNQLCVDYKGLFDFMYLPIDFKNKCNVGYGFINFRITWLRHKDRQV